MASFPATVVVVCVHYDDFLGITLPALLPHVGRVIVVTRPDDAGTLAVVDAAGPKVTAYRTDAFTRDGAVFNKGRAIEEAFDVAGRVGWFLVMDADILVPPDLGDQLWRLRPVAGHLYTPRRRILADPTRWSEYADPSTWSRLPLRQEDKGFYGYFQLFHAEDPVLRTRPWYPVRFTHAGRCDDVFQKRWPWSCKVRPQFEVVHLGPCDQNWFGRVTDRLDGTQAADTDTRQQRQKLRDALFRSQGWGGFRRDPSVRVDEVIGTDEPPVSPRPDTRRPPWV